MKLSDGEKLILMMLSELYEKLDIKGQIDPKLVQEAICGGEAWSLKRKYSGLFDIEETDPATVTEVEEILEMWWFLESAYNRLSKADKERVAAEAGPLGKDVKYPGFDGNNETRHLGVARVLIERLDRFGDLKGRGALNSHFPTLDMHHRMLEAFKQMRPTLAGGRAGADEVIALLKARIHPSKR
jgi:uncharacterized protein YfbU (UPF0304 family)